MPVRSWRSWKDWTASLGYAARDASSTPRRLRPARHSSATAKAVRPLLSFRPPGPTTRTSAGQRPSRHWTQGRRIRNIRWVSPAVRLSTRHPQLFPRANQPSCRRRDGRRFRKPSARGWRCGPSRGSWESTGPPSRNTWMPTVPQGIGPGRLSPRQALIQWQHDTVTFMLDT